MIFGSVESGEIEVDVNTTWSTDGLVGWWPFDGNASDMSGSGNHGSVYGATLSNDRNGNLNKAYSFDGNDDYIEVLNSNTMIAHSNKFSAIGWVKIITVKQFNNIFGKFSDAVGNTSTSRDWGFSSGIKWYRYFCIN